MKYSILNLLLGASLVIAAPAAMAENNWKEHKHQQKNVKKHVAKQHKKYNKKQNKHFVAKAPVKSHKDRKWVQQNNKHNSRHSSKHNNSVTITSYGWNNNSNGYRDNAKRYPVSIRDRRNKQASKIRKGVQKGQLVRREARSLRNEQRTIANRLANFRHDGRLNRNERARIHRMLDIAASNIRNKRHNRLTRHSQQNRYQDDNRYEFVFNW